MKPGQALVTLLVFIAVAVIITSAATALIIINSQTSLSLNLGQEAYQVAESGIENALLRLLRDPAYAGETLTVGQGTATIIVTGANPYTLTSTGIMGNFSRRLQTTAQFSSGILSVTSWQETF